LYKDTGKPYEKKTSFSDTRLPSILFFHISKKTISSKTIPFYQFKPQGGHTYN